MALRRAPGVRALGAARARVLHVRAPESPRLAPGLCSPAESRPPSSTHQSTPSPPLAPYSAAVRAPWRHASIGSRSLPWTAPPKPHARASCPLEQLELIRKLVGTHSSPPRRPAATEWRFAVLIHGRRGNRPRALLIGTPELLQPPRQPQTIHRTLPQPAIDGERPSSPSPVSSAAATL